MGQELSSLRRGKRLGGLLTAKRAGASVMGRIGSLPWPYRRAKNRDGTESSDRDRFQEANQCSFVGLITQGSGSGPLW